LLVKYFGSIYEYYVYNQQWVVVFLCWLCL